MTDREEILKLFMLDDPDPEAWERMFAALTHEDRIVYLKRIQEAMASDPDSFPEVPSDVIDQMGRHAAEYERADREARIAVQNAKLAMAKLESMSDAVLAAMPDTPKKGH
ncbi:MAG: hypothetical protein ABIV21_03495 [Pyrinomonadaceae bacterium]